MKEIQKLSPELNTPQNEQDITNKVNEIIERVNFICKWAQFSPDVLKELNKWK